MDQTRIKADGGNEFEWKNDGFKEPGSRSDVRGDEPEEGRLKIGLSTLQVAEFLGFETPARVYDYQEGNGFPNAEHLIKLLWLYGMQMQELLFVEGMGIAVG